MPISRRSLLKGAVAAGGLAALGPRVARADLGLNTNSPVDHIVVVMMENRSFDHFLGWVPKAETQQDLTFLDNDGVPHQTRHWAPDYSGCD